MNNHNITRESGGKFESGWVQPKCSCGWVGRKEYAYNDWQMTNVKDQEDNHFDDARKTAQNKVKA